ncbi:hypothetical protein SAMN04487981_101621 [Streptomyces sp. cf386]|uniref:hypothetical protein n=1 Tax=Streptomyces sp. cf386 TaxID=1761904 RepID=UPI000885804C|nr:hypothetical protein [Streptomyces sp. cf386]SDM46903.1 hypothetical protein SAMN04487981_101621 [Streptomyces sp. cf386]
MAGPAVIVWPVIAAIGAAGLLAVAPRRAPLLYLGPAACTVALITLAVTYVAAVWSH